MTNRLVLIDTSVWILALRKAPVPSVKQRVYELLGENRVATAPIICLELLGGAGSEMEFDRLKSRLAALHQVPLGEGDWEKAARLAFTLRRRGGTFPYADILIGSLAMTNDLLLLHADRHFDLIAQEVPLSVESTVSLVGQG